MRLLIAMLALAAPAAALAADEVRLTSEVFVERNVTQPDGSVRKVREAPNVVTPGETLVFVLTYRNEGAAAATGFVVTNPMPESVIYADSASPGEIVSVDGGQNWGELATLRVRNADGTMRPAADADVTHVRWRFAAPIPAGEGGNLSFQGVVR
jgi:uncharacterized repeat protein (TIGR01451 family)